jgi:lysophospholipase L1-like esterase
MRQLLFILLLGISWLQAISQSGQKLPANSKIIYFGDSQTSFGYSTNGNSVQFQNYGYIAWVNALAPDVYMPADGMQGVPGETTSQMINRLGAIVPTGGKVMVVLAGTNDPLYAITPSTTENNLRKIYDAGIAAGMKVIAITIMPRFSPNAYDATTEANRKLINAWIKSQSDIVVVDVENDLNDPKYFEDGLHNSPTGAYVLGNRVATEVNKLVDHCLPGSLNSGDLSVASNSSPLMTGTGGRTNVANGTVATNWQLAGNFASTATVTGSKETDADGREKQVIAISGTYTGNTPKVTFNNYAGGTIALNAGDVVEGVAEVEITAPMTGIRAVYLHVQAYPADYSTTLSQGYSMWSTSNKTNYIPPGKYLLRTPPMTIASGAPVGQLTTQIIIDFIGTTTVDPISATIKVSSIGIRKLPLMAGPTAAITPSGTVSLCPDSSLQLKATTGNGYTFQWNLNGAALAGNTAATYTANQTGDYTVKLSVPGCSVLSDSTVIKPGTNCPVPNSLQTGAVSTSLCSGQTLTVPFTRKGVYQDGNVFTAQLSDGKGSFANPVAIGSRSDTTDSIINVTLPTNLLLDTGYRIRIISSNPAVTGIDNGQGITIHGTIKASIIPSDTANSYPNLPLILTASPQDSSYQYQWLLGGEKTGTNNWRDTAKASGNYQVVISQAGACADTSKAMYVRMIPCGEITVGVLQSDNTTITVNPSGGHPPYLYSLNGASEQAGSTFSNLVPGQSYAVVVKDSVNCTAQYSFVLNGVQTGSIPTSLCSGQTLIVPFTALGHFQQGNVFSIQLSDGKGSFENPLSIGSLNDTTGTVIAAVVPTNLLPDTGYRIRVVSSNPATTGSDNGQSITIHAVAKASISPADTANSYPNLPLTLSASPQNDSLRYQWLHENVKVSEGSPTYTPTIEGAYRVVVTGTGGCADTSKPTYVRMLPCADMTITVNSPDASVFTVNVSGGHAPYQYSLDSVNYQSANRFSNLTPGRDYTVYIKDSVNCSGKLTFTIQNPKDCDAQQWISGRSTSFATQNLGTKAGLVVVTYELLPLPDQIDIYYDDSTVVTTRNLADSLGWLWFQYSPRTEGPDQCNIRMQTSTDATAWKYTALCPLNNYTVMKTGEDTTSNAVFVSPNFPNAYPANTTLVHTFTPTSIGAKLHVDFKALLLTTTGLLTVYDGPDTLSPVLGQFSGGYRYDQNPTLVANNPTGQLTFKFASGNEEGRYGWVADVYYRTSVDSFYPQTAKMGDTIIIKGAGFNGTTAVRFGGNPALSYQVLSDNSIRAVVGTGLSGAVEVISSSGTAARAGFSFNPDITVCPGGNQTLVSNLQGFIYQWQVSTDSVNFVDITDNEEYGGTDSPTLQLKNLSSSHYGNQYRCVVDSANGTTYTIRFATTWVGGVSSDWENAGNWSCGVLPDANTDVIINIATVNVSSNVSIRSLTVQPGANVTLGANAVFRVTH